jgi:hypothetical protein
MFEAIHGSAPRRAGQNLANPSGLFLGAVQMLVHIGQGDVATKVHNAWLKTIEDGIHTYDVYDPAVSTQKVGTSAFADAIIERIGQEPETLEPVRYESTAEPIDVEPIRRPPAIKELVGRDLEDDLVVHLQDDPAVGAAPLLERPVEAHQRHLEDVGGEALDAGVHGLALPGLADPEVARGQLGDGRRRPNSVSV